MSENMSQNTENDFLDQTFKDIDSSVSLEETEDQGTQEIKKPTDKKGGMSTNAKIISGVGVAAAGLLGYWLLTANQQPMQAPVSEAPAPMEQAQPEQPEAPAISFNEPAPVVEPTQHSVNADSFAEPATVPAVDPFAPSTSVVDPFAEQSAAPAIDPFAASVVISESIPQISEPIPPIEPINTEVASVLESAVIQPVEPMHTPVSQPAVEPIQTIANNAAQTAHVDELRSLFDKHSVEIDKLDIRVTALEAKFDKSIQEQLLINKKVEERLAKLEAGGSSVRTSATNSSNASKSSKAASSSKAKSGETQRKRVKKASTQKQVAKTTKVTVVNEPALESITLVDKREVVAVAKPKPQTLDIHSVFSGRLWIKNPDSTLSTYAVGEIIPGGEKISRIDELNKKIYTNKRVISYQ